MKIIANTLLAAMFISSVACSSKEKEKGETKENSAIPVRVMDLQARSIANTLDYTANLVADEEVFYAPASPGRIEKIYVEVGDNIRKGQKLVTMDKTQLVQAQVQYKNAEAEYKRAQMLDKTGSISKQNFDALEANYQVAKANYEFLAENTELTAPFNGVVTGKFYEDGEMYSASPTGTAKKASIISIEKINPIKAFVNLTESYYPVIKEGTEIKMTSKLYPTRVFTGKVKIKYPTVDPATRTFTVEVVIPNNDLALRPGMFGEINFLVGETNTLVVPALAVLKLQGSNDRYVYLNENGKAKRVAVKIGRRFDDQVEIISDQIKEGDQLVVVGQGRLVDGAPIEIKGSNEF